jgi:SNF2 family DNA or RNA helicase
MSKGQLHRKLGQVVSHSVHTDIISGSVVFSTWRTTLDVIQSGLEQAHIRYLRFDGNVPQKERQGIINRFRQDSSVQVLLLTLSCGAVG